MGDIPTDSFLKIGILMYLDNLPADYLPELLEITENKIEEITVKIRELEKILYNFSHNDLHLSDREPVQNQIINLSYCINRTMILYNAIIQRSDVKFV
jgi:hypothetical protein